MREVEQLDVCYSNDNEKLCSVFVGVCESQELLEKYLDKDYDLLMDNCIGFEMGIDFGINTYDEDFAVWVFQKKLTRQIDKIIKDAEVFDIDALKKMYPDGLDKPYNTIIILDRMIYDGPIKEVQNKDFGYFKFLGVFDSG